MDSNHDAEIVGAKKDYLEQCIEDLAQDQIATDARVDALQRKVLLVAGAAGGAIGLAVLAVKMNKMVIANLQQIAESLYVTQQQMGMVPVSEPPVHPSVHNEEAAEDAVSDGGVYDPGPQDVPPAVREAIVSDPLPADPHEDGNGLR